MNTADAGQGLPVCSSTVHQGGDPGDSRGQWSPSGQGLHSLWGLFPEGRAHRPQPRGSLRAVTEADLLFCLVCISHLAALYLRVADLGYHNLAWQVESLAVSRAENTHLTSQALRTRPFVPLVLIDGGRWTQGVQASFPGKAGTKGLFALCNRFPSFGEWVQQMVYSYSSAETLCKGSLFIAFRITRIILKASRT